MNGVHFTCRQLPNSPASTTVLTCRVFGLRFGEARELIPWKTSAVDDGSAESRYGIMRRASLILRWLAAGAAGSTLALLTLAGAQAEPPVIPEDVRAK